MIKIKNKNLQALYLGNRPISRVYVGDSLVWPDGNMGLIFDGKILPVGLNKEIISGNLVFAGSVLLEKTLPIVYGNLSFEGFPLSQNTLPIISGNLSMQGVVLPTNTSNIIEGNMNFNGVITGEENG